MMVLRQKVPSLTWVPQNPILELLCDLLTMTEDRSWAVASCISPSTSGIDMKSHMPRKASLWLLTRFLAWRHSSVTNCLFIIAWYLVLYLTASLICRSFEFCGNQISVTQVKVIRSSYFILKRPESVFNKGVSLFKKQNEIFAFLSWIPQAW